MCGKKIYDIEASVFLGSSFYRQEYIFPGPRKVYPRDRTEVRTCFFFREKVSLSEVVGKKDRLSNRAEWLSARAKRGETA